MRNDVEQAIEKFKIFTFGNKKHIERAQEKLNNDEHVLFVTPTTFTTSSSSKVIPATLFLTDKRIVFYYCFPSDQFDSDEIPINKVRSVRYHENRHKSDRLILHSVNNSYEFTVISQANIRQIYQEFESIIDNYRTQLFAHISTQQQNIPQPDIPEQIEKLAQLRDKGIITEEEFQAKKADLLSRL